MLVLLVHSACAALVLVAQRSHSLASAFKLACNTAVYCFYLLLVLLLQIMSVSPAANGAVKLAVASKLKKSDKLIDMAEGLMTIDGIVGVDLT
jgi:pentose-5-phosphate-3-epimerase